MKTLQSLYKINLHNFLGVLKNLGKFRSPQRDLSWEINLDKWQEFYQWTNIKEYYNSKEILHAHV